MDWFTTLRALGSLLLLTGILALFSDNRKRIPWLLVAKGLVIQFVFAFLILRVKSIESGFQAVGQVFVNILGYTREGSLFLFGSLISNTDSFGYIFAFQVLPTVIFFSALTSLLYYWGILQKVVWVFAYIMRWTLKISGAESLAAAGNIFLGQTEAPLLVKPYIGKMTKSELLSLMTGGMATIAGGVLAAYIGYLGGDSEASRLFFAKHLLAASVMSAPAAIVAAKILVPETETFNQEMHISRESNGDHWLDALSRGTSDGLKLAVNVGAMLLVFTAFIYLVNSILADGIGAYTGLNAWMADFSGGRYTSFNLQAILGLSLAPLTWLMGVNWTDAALVGQLLGEKTILNEFYAYVTLGNLIETGALVETKSQVMATYILCGFANFASIGIQIGGIGTLAPHRRADLSRLGVKALVGGTVASLFTAVLVGLFY
jgi:CNT family concentrative nucleoside transporter